MAQTSDAAVGAAPMRHARLLQAATAASVAIATLLILGKLVAWLFTGSVSLLSSLIDSLMDVAASLVNLVAVRHALTPPDREHRFGHGKAEPLAGLAQAAFITGSALFLLVEAVHRLVTPRPIEAGAIGIAVMAVSMALTIGLVLFQNFVVRRTGSTAIDADALHYRTDVMVNGAVIVAILLSDRFGWTWADPVFALAIVVYILVGATRIARRSLDLLMDREFAEADRARIRDIVLDHPDSRNMHELRTRSSGVQPFIQFHLELDAHLSLLRAHEIADEIEARVKAAFPGAEVIIHQDPAGFEAPPASLASGP
ncbi:MAG: cation diffusion facilitator family transporter [Alphaproteobacteria bacterium]